MLKSKISVRVGARAAARAARALGGPARALKREAGGQARDDSWSDGSPHMQPQAGQCIPANRSLSCMCPTKTHGQLPDVLVFPFACPL